ncbi:hypothetical protein BDB00DRAFT_931521 [Zychaea mexicana]|uniref:uncharacterized protein n=1 Tax=Zychaea mexicana TaxID=64656 RepID=UPI0022FF14EB|nr:uncharacterized protein BDB00DRAFT_931521 [Zychaea mexicana]KAI9490000.1 hypothetical protein BDB00DRAFT_931521 [Zychaea mexicana]
MLKELLTGYSDAGSRTLKLGADCRVSIAESRMPRVECQRVECRESNAESRMPRVERDLRWHLAPHASPTMADQTRPADKASNRKDTTIFLWRKTEKDFSVL